MKRRQKMFLIRLTFLLMLLMLAIAKAFGDESFIPSTPVAPADDTVTGYFVTEFGIRVPLGDTLGARVDVTVVGTKAPGVCAMKASPRECVRITVAYTGADAVTLINALNTANLTNNSLRKRVITKLQTDGFIPAGSITGAAGVPTPLPTTGP